MTKFFERKDGVVIADRQNHTMEEWTGPCQLCGAVDELRPCGPKHEMICFDCGMKDKDTTDARLRELMDGE